MNSLNELRDIRVQAATASQSKLVALLLSVSQEQSWRPAEDAWSYRDVAAHMLQVEIACFWERMQRILAEDEPEFRFYLNSDWQFGPIVLQDALSEWITWRKRVIALASSLNQSQLQRVGVHSHFGRISPLDLLKIAVDHDAEHYLDLQKTISL